jgi:hypothetical protein
VSDDEQHSAAADSPGFVPSVESLPPTTPVLEFSTSRPILKEDLIAAVNRGAGRAAFGGGDFD